MSTHDIAYLVFAAIGACTGLAIITLSVEDWWDTRQERRRARRKESTDE